MKNKCIRRKLKRIISIALSAAVLVSPSATALSNTHAAPDNENNYYFNDSFEDGTDEWTGRGSATVGKNMREFYKGTASLYCSGRTASWNGASKSLDSTVFTAGQSFSFSVNVMYLKGESTENFKLTLQYTAADGETYYDEIASASVEAGQWTQLANNNYLIPEDASSMQIYVETIDTQLRLPRKAGFSIRIPIFSGKSISFPRCFSSIIISSSVGIINPETSRISIVFPQPLYPHSPYIIPLFIERLTLLTTVFPPIIFVTFFNSIFIFFTPYQAEYLPF